jgi:two-component system phosphate regulon sensor histidine kinase PhoR
MRPVAEISGLRLMVETDADALVTGDTERLRQVVYNLLDNAIKYTPAGGQVAVRVKRAQGSAILIVHDTGIGIPGEHLTRVFERFYRVDRARSRERGGTGLGLSIVRSIVEAHDGKIVLESEPGKGTTCIVSLPLCSEGETDLIRCSLPPTRNREL